MLEAVEGARLTDRAQELPGGGSRAASSDGRSARAELRDCDASSGLLR
jgi:hypothetical protein